jgi:methylated-DNA-protein-cysteine methyltransferase-like protein
MVLSVCQVLIAMAESTEAEHIARQYGDIYAVVRRIPRGRVLTYGQVAELAGRPGAARMAGAAMRVVPVELALPWQRVIGKKGKGLGKVSIHDPVGGAIQRQMLEAEGVVFSESGSTKLADFGWISE